MVEMEFNEENFQKIKESVNREGIKILIYSFSNNPGCIYYAYVSAVNIHKFKAKLVNFMDETAEMNIKIYFHI